MSRLTRALVAVAIALVLPASVVAAAVGPAAAAPRPLHAYEPPFCC